MTTGAKIAIGCGIAVLLAGAVAIVGMGLGAYWLKGKAQSMTGGIEALGAKAEEIEKYEKQANANPFSAPADGVIRESQLQEFLAVRKQIYAVYEQHRPEFESLAERTKGDKQLSVAETLEAGGKIASLAADVRLAQAKALAEAGMSEQEYRFIQMAVYRSAWAAGTERESGNQASEMMSEAMKQGQQALRESLERAKEAGATGAGQVSEADVGEAERAIGEMGKNIEQLRVPQSNVELFRKYEAEINKYAMHGLAFLGL